MAGPEARAAIGGWLFVITAAQTDIGQALQQRHPGLLRMLFVGIPAGLPDFVLRGHRQVFEFRHPRGANGSAFRRLRDECLGRHQLLGRDLRDIKVGEQCRLLRDRTNRDIAIGRRLQRLPAAGCETSGATAAAMAASAARSTLPEARCGAAGAG